MLLTRIFSPVVFSLLISAFFIIPFVSLAQETAGIGMAPTLIEEGADPGDVITEDLTITNLSDTTQTYYLYTRDISGVRAGGSPVFADEGTERTGYEVTEWISLSQTELTLTPSAEGTIGVTIAVPENATPGSHFGGIFASVEPPKLRTVGAGVGYQVANIVSIRISGDVTEQAQIRTLSTDKLIYGATEVEFTARVENKGNVLVRPYGPLEITNMFGKQVASIPFNDSQGGVFPGTIRDFKITWEDQGLGFGRYSAILSLGYGEQGVARQTTFSETSFWVLPMAIIKPALIALGVLLVLAYVAVKLYVRRTVQVITKGRGGRKLVRRRSRGGQSVGVIVAIVMLVVTALFLLLLLVLFA